MFNVFPRPPTVPVGGGMNWAILEGVTALGNVSGAVNLDLSAAGGRRAFSAQLIGNVTLNPQNVPPGLVSVAVVLTQDATGGRSVAIPPSSTLLGGEDGAINPAPASRSIITMMTTDSGANWLVAIGDSRPGRLEMFNFNPPGNGAYYATFSRPVRLDLGAVQLRGTGTVAYARSTDGATFSTVAGVTDFAAGNVLRYTVSAFADWLALAIPAVITPVTLQAGSLQRQVNANLDSISQVGGYWGTVDPLYYDFPSQSNTAIRFTNITIPRGATITSAILRVFSNETGTRPAGTGVVVRGEGVDNPPMLVDIADHNARRVNLTAASVTLDYGGDVAMGAAYDRSVTVIVQELTARPGWNSGNAIMLFADARNIGNWQVRSHFQNPAQAPILLLEWLA